MIQQLNLPKPSEKLINLIKSVARARPTNYASIEYHEAVQKPGMNCAAGDFFSEEQVSLLAIKEFQKFFHPYKMSPLIGILRNTKPNSLASYCPHTDRVRTVAINFYIEIGGSNVTTVFYDKQDPSDDLVGGNMLSYEQLNKVGEQHFVQDVWYMFHTRQFHSVENIENDRVILTLSFKDCSMEDILDTAGINQNAS